MEKLDFCNWLLCSQDFGVNWETTVDLKAAVFILGQYQFTYSKEGLKSVYYGSI